MSYVAIIIIVLVIILMISISIGIWVFLRKKSTSTSQPSEVKNESKRIYRILNNTDYISQGDIKVIDI